MLKEIFLGISDEKMIKTDPASLFLVNIVALITFWRSLITYILLETSAHIYLTKLYGAVTNQIIDSTQIPSTR